MSRGKELLSTVSETFLILLTDTAAGETRFLASNSIFFATFSSLLRTKNNACLCYRSVAAFVIAVMFSLPLVLLATQLMI